MAKKAAEEERNVKVKAKVNLKYDSDVVKMGGELEIRESDLEELQNKEYVSYTPPVQTQQTGQETGQQAPPAEK
ncbi:hypothetical protein [Clostridium ljungdahlii]|uniref:DUF7210 domain-containing protein n=1 Tax=Clostridium ljungdahlii (strain ATCC 55383 / DSM 13528 / PETC) TaxID=748727 RepID=D8GQ87_CLOLD|nr:hypothetical protein [Clostridium ljungdahlii]ADK16178.1 hypothetical protein CLJU_c31300 [Clostridium ljungdahlii DSM 13528]OAA89953.1 hypothetical protein WX45_01792 [Clostridium ljungdahlii DSM 13528]